MGLEYLQRVELFKDPETHELMSQYGDLESWEWKKQRLQATAEAIIYLEREIAEVEQNIGNIEKEAQKTGIKMGLTAGALSGIVSWAYAGPYVAIAVGAATGVITYFVEVRLERTYLGKTYNRNLQNCHNHLKTQKERYESFYRNIVRTKQSAEKKKGLALKSS